MPIPDFQSFFKPLLEIAADGKEHSLKEARQTIASNMALTDEELNELLPSGTQAKFDNRVAWAKIYLTKAQALESPRRAYFKITDRGMMLLKQGLDRIDVKVLNQFPEFVEFHTAKSATTSNNNQSEPNVTETPEETLQKSYLSIRNELASEILDRIKQNSPQFFEHLVVDIMLALGYGGSLADAGQSIGQSGDEGIDGIIKEDRLGLDVIYLQAKRWEGSVGRPEIQKFVGALHGKRAKKGVFITTGKFSDDAQSYVTNIDPKVILIDGKMLADLMIDYGLGTNITAKYEIRKIDSDYFNEE
ncbi:restriction endonuclease [bacterium]|nr:restriction endonuclease [bacterium]